jgi:hypothetical protein
MDSAPIADVVIMAFNRAQQLLLWCLGSTSQFPLLPDDTLEWGAFLDLAQSQNIVPIVANKLRSFPPGNFPAKIISTLQAWHLESTRHNMALLMALSSVLDLLKEGGVTAIPFKGPTTAMMAYGDLSQRTCGDLDILVTQDEYPKVISILQSNGYAVTERYESAMQSTLVHEGSTISIDLHWGIPPREIDLNVGLLRKSLRDFDLAGKTVQTFSVNDMFLIHCINATKEYWRPNLRQFYDIKMFVEHADQEWQTVLTRARDIGCERMVMVSLLVAHNLYTLPLPKPIMSQLQRCSYAGRVAQELENQLYINSEIPLGRQFGKPLMFRNHRTYYLALTDSPVQRVLGWTRLILTPTTADLEYFCLPRPLSFLYYLIRPFRLLLKTLLG